MKRQAQTEFDRFDKVMDGLLAVPYKELQQKLDEEKRTKAQKKRATSSSLASRASSSRKKRVA